MSEKETNGQKFGQSVQKGIEDGNTDPSNLVLGGLTAVNPLVGGIAAGLKGVLDVAAKKKREKREADVTLQTNLGNIESQKAANQSQIISQLGSNLAATLKR